MNNIEKLDDELAAFANADHEIPATSARTRAAVIAGVSRSLAERLGPPPAPANAPISTDPLRWWMRWGTGFVFGAALGVATTLAWAVSREVAPIPQTTTTVLGSPPAQGEPVTQTQEAPALHPSAQDQHADTPDVEGRTPERRRGDTRETTPRAATPSTLVQEARLIDGARAALAQQNPVAARELLARHAEQFPEGQLAEERELLRARAQ